MATGSKWAGLAAREKTLILDLHLEVAAQRPTAPLSLSEDDCTGSPKSSALRLHVRKPNVLQDGHLEWPVSKTFADYPSEIFGDHGVVTTNGICIEIG